jgi:hypothetical protein
MKKKNLINIESLIYLYPVSFFFPNILSFFDIFLINKIRLDQVIIFFLSAYMFYKFFKIFCLPNLKILLIFFIILIHVIKAIIFTNFLGEIDYYKLIGYIEGYISFALMLLFINFYYSIYSYRAKDVLINFLNYFIISSIFVLAITILLALNMFNVNLVKLFSSNPGMVKIAYDVGRYIGPFPMPVEGGFYSGIGIIICFLFWKYNITNKILLLLGFLSFNIIGLLSGSKVYLLAIIATIGLTFFFVIKTKKTKYIIFFVAILLFQIILSVTVTLVYKNINNSAILYKFYIMKYYNLNTFLNKNLKENLRIISGGRYKIDKPKENQLDQSKENQLDQSKENQLDQSKENQLDQSKENQLDQTKEYKQLFFAHKGALDSQHKMVVTHGGNISLFLLIFFYFYLYYLILKLYFKSNNLGIILLTLTTLVIATSAGFPVFFSNKVFIFCCIIINLVFILSDKKNKFIIFKK